MSASSLPATLEASTFTPMAARKNSADEYVPMNALARLIHRRKAELELTWHEIGKRGDFHHSVVYALATKEIHKQPPRGETIARLARALEVSEDVVRAAAYDAAGGLLQEIPTTLEAAEDVRVVVAAMNEMSPADRRKLRRLAMAFQEDSRTQPTDEQAQQEAQIRAELSDALAAVDDPAPAAVTRLRTKRDTKSK